MAFYKDYDDKFDNTLDTGTIDITASLGTQHDAVISSEYGIRFNTARYQILYLPAMLLKGRGINVPNFYKVTDDGSGSGGIYTYGFNKNQEEELFGATLIPHGWDHGQFSVRIYWFTQDAMSTGDKVCWAMECSMESETSPTVSNSEVIYGDTHFPPMDLPAKGIAYTDLSLPTVPSNPFHCFGFRVFRDGRGDYGTDTYADDAMLCAVGVRYRFHEIGAPLTEW